MTTHAARRAPDRTVRRRAAAGAWSTLVTFLGAWWILRPQDSPFQPGADGFPSLLQAVSPSTAGAVLVVAGLVGLATLLVGRGTRIVAAAHVLLFGVAIPGAAPIALAGYAMAMLGPVVLVGTVLAGAWRWRGGWLVLGAFALVGAVAALTGLADASVLERYAEIVTGSAERILPPALSTFLLLGAAVWGVLGFADRIGEAFVLRRGRVATYVAAACVLPYGLLRMTWLTPWPFGGAQEFLAHPEIRLHGLLLGLAALAGGLLTLGLVSRWGEVWPRFVPVVRGRPVPVAAAVVPGMTVATVVTSAAVPIAVQSVVEREWDMLVIFPFWLWGPALAVAVLGYAARRGAAAHIPAITVR